MAGVFVVPKSDLGEVLPELNKIMQDWTDAAAKGDCGWVCSDCCCSFPEGMPDECAHGDSRCTSIIKRDKANAKF